MSRFKIFASVTIIHVFRKQAPLNVDNGMMVSSKQIKMNNKKINCV